MLSACAIIGHNSHGLCEKLKGHTGERIPSYQVLVQGKTRPIASLVREDVFRITERHFATPFSTHELSR